MRLATERTHDDHVKARLAHVEAERQRGEGSLLRRDAREGREILGVLEAQRGGRHHLPALLGAELA
jgi:hypothetical protein